MLFPDILHQWLRKYTHLISVFILYKHEEKLSIICFISKVHEIKTPIATQLDFAELLNSQKEQRKKKKHPQNFFFYQT